VAWLVALSPAGKFGKGIAPIIAIATSVESVRYSRQLVIQESRRGAMTAMNQELETVDLALQAYSQEQALREMYGLQPTYSPEVREELEKSLEHLYNEQSAVKTVDTTTSTSRKNLYIAVVSLLEVGKSDSYIVEEVLQFKGRRFKEGQKALQDLLQEGREHEW
jgi:ferredoxin-NADP reductase